MSEDYAWAVNEALGRLTHAGFFFGGRSGRRGLVMHAPMGAEALATLGFPDQVPGWVDWYVTVRDISQPPEPVAAIDPAREADWRPALGQPRRLADWAGLFRRQVSDLGWQATLAAWWPRLLPGMRGGLGHGLIRTAHAVRSVASAEAPSELQLGELASGLAFWAGMYQPLSGPAPSATPTQADAIAGSPDLAGPQAPDAELTALTASYAGRYAGLPPGTPAVPLVHTITAPAAMRMVLPHLPPELAGPSCQAITAVCHDMFSGLGRSAGPPVAATGPADPAGHDRVILRAVELRDEHGIKLAEAAAREYRANPDSRYFAAAAHALRLLGADG